MKRRFGLGAVAATCGALVLAGVVTPPGATAAGAPADRTSRTEARRVAAVKSPTIRWSDCSALVTRGRCGSLRVPLDYDRPNGPWIDIALFKVTAAKPRLKQGTLFLNPGGPGGSGVEIATVAPRFLGKEVLDRFDVVGFDPRGTNLSTNVRCWPDANAQALAYKDSPAVPLTTADRRLTAKVARQVGRACSTTGRPLSASMSTAEVARDLEVMRRAVGDRKLNYLGFSYGTYLGAVYANMFPDRAGRLVVDGVLDPVGWSGTRATRNIPLENRIRSAEAGTTALNEFFERCVGVGTSKCAMLKHGDPAANFKALVARLRGGGTITWTDPDGRSLSVDLPSVLFTVDGILRGRSVDLLDEYLAAAFAAMKAPTTSAALAGSVKEAARLQSAVRAASDGTTLQQGLAKRYGVTWPYQNGPEAYQSVLCTDGLHPARTTDWIGFARRTEAKYPLFGGVQVWASAACARNSWTARDEDAYRGVFSRRTRTPVLVVGNYWDPATSYKGAQALARVLGNGRLVSSDNWGHTAYGSSACVTDAIDAYLVTGVVPRKGTVCHSTEQPFSSGAARLSAVGRDGAPSAAGAGLAARRSALESALAGAGPVKAAMTVGG